MSAAQHLQEGRAAEAAQIASDVAVKAEKARAWDATCYARLLQAHAEHLCQEEPLMWVSYLTSLVAASYGRKAQPSWIMLTFFLMAQEMADTGNVARYTKVFAPSATPR